MDFNDTPEEQAFRQRAIAFLDANAQRRKDSETGVIIQVEPETLQLAKDWQRRKAEAGFAAITYPREHGGADGTILQEVIFGAEEAKYLVPRGVFEITLGNCIPTLMQFGDEAAKRRFVPAAVRGDEVWCQLFSEPAAGSDLAALRTRADSTPEGWRVQGQKVWTSGAHFADWGLLLARTDPSAPKHGGLTMFYIDMRSPGVECRPIRQLNGAAEFNEVFLTDVLIPDAQRLGAVGSGWRVAMATLGYERGKVGGGLGLLDFSGLLDIARDATVAGQAAAGTPRFQEALVDFYLKNEGLRLNYLRALTALSRGGAPGPEYAIGKLVAARAGQAAAYAALETIGEAGMLAPEELGDAWRLAERSWTWGAALRIAGGSEEILKSLIADRVLGLPAEPRLDKDAPFSDLD